MRIFISISVALLLAALVAPAAAHDRNNWHVHDGDGPHAGAAPLVFFPTILTGGDVDAYLEDPAHCPNATDKALLGADGPHPGALPFVGICMTSDQIIHIKVGGPAPTGWSWIEWPPGSGQIWYYKLTDR